jgi:choline monooxygenase
VPIIVTRDETGTVRAFVNVCRHRGSILVAEECGHGKIFQCPYHAWTYGLDGALRAAPGMREEASFDREQFSLFGLRAELWGTIHLRQPRRRRAPLAAALGELPALVAATGAPLTGSGGACARSTTSPQIGKSWSIIIWSVPLPVAHPGFTQLIDTNNYTITEYDLFSTQGGALREEKQGAESLYDTSGAVRDGFYAYLWPNFTLNIYPGQGNTSINLFLPLGPDRTRAIFEYCFVETVGEEEERDFVRFIEQVQVEDIVLCETVQRGLGTGFFDQGKLMLRQEGALRHFQRLVHRFVTA